MSIARLSLAQIKTEIDNRAVIIGAAGHQSLPTYGYSEDFARPHIEADARGYHLVIVERLEERSRFTTSDLSELLYRVFEAVTFSLAVEYEPAHRVADKDGRRIIFARQIDLLTRLCAIWGERKLEEQQRVLLAHPFGD